MEAVLKTALAGDWAATSRAVNVLGRDLVMWANPTLDYAHRATAGWPLIELDAALLVAAGYAVLVLLGLIKRGAAGFPATAAAEEKAKSIAAKFAREPVLYFMTLYNVAQVALCGYMMVQAAAIAVASGYSPICNPFNQADTAMTRILWIFYLSKVLDFFDTAFIILRGKWDQFSFLHVYHHFSIFLTYWLVANAGYTGDVYYTIVANSLVHFVMYFYYFLSGTFNYRAWWGRMLTQMQMLQFLTMNAQAIYIVTQGCAYPHPLTKFYLAYIISLFALFYHFFLRRWGGKGGKAASKAAKGE